VIRTLAFMGGYTAIILAVSSSAFDEYRQHPGRPGRWPWSVSAPVIGQIWATLA
jgi:putative oxidoreductase